MASVAEKLRELDHLPAIPVAVTQLISNLCGNENDPAAEPTGRIVMRDSALSAAVLRVANSAALGFQVESVTIEDALSRVGENELLKIALAHASQAALGGPIDEYGLEEGAAWIGGLAGALAAEELAKLTRIADPNICFTAGLLRDIGKLAMGLIVPRDELTALLCFGNDEVTTRERKQLGFDHSQVGAALGRTWGLPDELLNSMRFHHDPPTDENEDPLHHVVHTADCLALMLGYGVGFDGLSYSLKPESREALGLQPADIESLLVTVRLRMDEYLVGNAA